MNTNDLNLSEKRICRAIGRTLKEFIQSHQKHHSLKASWQRFECDIGLGQLYLE